MKSKINKIAVIGMGYVGLPLSLEFAKKDHVIGFDIDNIRIKSLKKRYRLNRRSKKRNFKIKKKLSFPQI